MKLSVLIESAVLIAFEDDSPFSFSRVYFFVLAGKKSEEE